MPFSRVFIPLGLIITLFAMDVARADHPDAEKLLPEKTLLFIKIENMQDFVKKFTESPTFKMLADEKVAPIVKSLYGSAEEAYGTVEAQLGVSLDEIRNLVQGEVTFSLVSMGKDEPMRIAAFIDYSGNQETADKLLKFGEDQARENEAKIEEETVGEVTIRSISAGSENFHYFQKKESICITNDLGLSKLILARWAAEVGEEVSAELKEELGESLEKRTFSKNRKFLNIMKQCGGDDDNPPEAKFFVDPFELIRVNQSGVAGTAALGILRGLGVDGLLGIGGSMLLDHEEFDTVFHLHVGLANPRSGIIKMIAMEPGDLTPESIFPSGTANYFTTNWNTITTYNEIEKLYDMFNEEGAFAEFLEESFTENFGLDLKEDILESLDGRISLAQYMVDPGSINGMGVMISAKLKDAGKFEDIFLDLRDAIEDLAPGDNDIFTPERNRGVEYFKLPEPPTAEERRERIERQIDEARKAAGGGDEARPPRRRRVAFGIRNPQPCVGIIGDYFVFTDSEDMMKEAIKNHRNPDDILADDPDYKQLTREIRRQLDGKKPAMIIFSRPSESIRMFYEALKDDRTRSAIKDRSEDQPFFMALQKAFLNNELPDFEDLEKYFTPSAGVMTNDETGFHFMSFERKIDLEE